MANPYTLGAASSAGTASLNCGCNSSHSAGDVVVVSVWGGANVTSVTDSKGNSYVPANAKFGSNQWVTTGKTVALLNTDTVTVKQSASAAMNIVLTGVPGAIFAPVDATGSASGSGTSASLQTSNMYSSDGQTLIVMVASAASLPTWLGPLTGLGTSHGVSTEFVGVAYQTGLLPAAATAAATVTSGNWNMLAITLQMTSFVNNAPNPPTQNAGGLATSAQMNTLAQTALFLRRPPMAIAQSATSGTGQSMTAVSAPVVWSTMQRDTDGFFAPANNTRLTVQTPGFYRVRYSIPFDQSAQNCQAWVRLTTGANNPAGAGVTSGWWYAFAGSANALNGAVCGGGVIPPFMYQADYIEVMQNVVTTSNMPTSPQPALVSLRMVSA